MKEKPRFCFFNVPVHVGKINRPLRRRRLVIGFKIQMNVFRRLAIGLFPQRSPGREAIDYSTTEAGGKKVRKTFRKQASEVNAKHTWADRLD